MGKNVRDRIYIFVVILIVMARDGLCRSRKEVESLTSKVDAIAEEFLQSTGDDALCALVYI